MRLHRGILRQARPYWGHIALYSLLTFLSAPLSTIPRRERQRISLARAFLKDAPILVLDEPTNSVDVHTQAAILDAPERLMRGRTTFMIAHRLDTLQRCDVRVTLDSGRLSHGSADTGGVAAATMRGTGAVERANG